jgi:hypothetical protein
LTTIYLLNKFRKCGQYNLKNFYTQTAECPFNFDKYLIHESTQTENAFRRECRHCKFYTRRCCDDVVDGTGQRNLKLYACNSRNKQSLKDLSSGLLSIPLRYVYGGSFTSVRVNPVTGTQKCPNDQFKVIQVTTDLAVCLADQVIDTGSLPHYGGMFSCSQGNIALASGTNECSDGYSAYVMGAIEGDCLLYVCLKFEKLLELRKLPSVVLPPFFSISIRNQTRQIVGSDNADHESSLTSTSPTPKAYKITLGLSITSFIIVLFIAIAFIVFRVRNRRSTY